MSTQRTLFLTREQKQELLDRADLSVPNSTPRTARAIARLLWAIETLPESSRTKPILATRMECSPRNCARVIRYAEWLGVLHTVAAPGDASYYTIDWPAISRRQKQMSPVTSKCHPCHPNVTGDIQMSRVTFADGSSEVYETTTKTGVSEENRERHNDCDAGAYAMNVCMNEMNESIHLIHKAPDDPPAPSAKPTPKRGSLGPGGWPEKITDQTLASPAGIQRLWEFALDRGWVESDKREEVFALACCVSRLARDRANMKNPGGAFTTRLRDKDWLCASQADYAKARAILDGLARGIVAPQDRPASPPAAPEVPREPTPIDLDARRRAAEQTRQLLLSRIGDSHQ